MTKPAMLAKPAIRPDVGTVFAINTPFGPAKAHTYSLPWDPMQHMAVIFGDIRDGVATLSAEPEPLEVLTDRVFSCFGRAASRIIVGDDTLNRLGILGQLSHAQSSGQRRQLFLALTPVWQSINGDNSPGSPYRKLLRLRRLA